MTEPLIRDETPADAAALSTLITAAFATAPHAAGTEAQIVDALRADGALILSLVADSAGSPVGHLAASPATVAGQGGWACIGPLAVAPDHQRAGIGAALMRAAIVRLAGQGLHGVVLVGDPAYYGRFGFQARPGLSADPVPALYVQALPLAPAPVWGPIAFHPAFGVG